MAKDKAIEIGKTTLSLSVDNDWWSRIRSICSYDGLELTSLIVAGVNIAMERLAKGNLVVSDTEDGKRMLDAAPVNGKFSLDVLRKEEPEESKDGAPHKFCSFKEWEQNYIPSRSSLYKNDKPYRENLGTLLWKTNELVHHECEEIKDIISKPMQEVGGMSTRLDLLTELYKSMNLKLDMINKNNQN